MKRQRDSESKARELAKFMAQQEKEENGDMKGQLGSANAEILRLREQCDKLTLSIREHKEASQKANTAMAKEKERRREAELKLLEATNDRDQEQDRRVKAETQADEYVFQRDLLDAELKAMEEKAALHYMGVNSVSHIPVQIAGMDRHALEKALHAKEESLKEEGRKARSREEIWAHDRAALQAQLTSALSEAKRLRAHLDEARDEELRLRREMDTRVGELVKAQGDRVAADELRRQAGLEAAKLREEKKMRTSRSGSSTTTSSGSPPRTTRSAPRRAASKASAPSWKTRWIASGPSSGPSSGRRCSPRPGSRTTGGRSRSRMTPGATRGTSPMAPCAGCRGTSSRHRRRSTPPAFPKRSSAPRAP